MMEEPKEQVRTLEPADRLTAADFMRRYEASPQIRKAELIEGVVYIPSPARYRQHGHPESQIHTWLGTYAAFTPGVKPAGNTTVRMDPDNIPQPDVLLRLEIGGSSRIEPDGFLVGPPELIVEVASSSASYDLGVKKNAYRRNGVQEYLVWRVLDQAFDWFILREGAYEPLAQDHDGLLKSEVFPGLWLDAGAMLDDRMDRVLETLEVGLATDAHRTFKARLAGG
jgi:Uma2 family endonuclease